MPRRHILRAVATVVVLLVGSCGSSGGGETLTVFAAASLSDSFEELAAVFEEAHPGVTVRLNLAGSSSLREQILAGAPADVFASADEANMDPVVEGGLVAEVATFATNDLQIVVPAGNPGHVDGIEDLADESLLLGLCAEEVPCGDLARRALDAAGVVASPDTNEPDVRSLLTKVEAGELDAGIVYRTDALAAGDEVEAIDIPAASTVVTRYPIAVLVDAPHPDRAQEFVDLVRSATGQAVLASDGFGPP